MYGVESGGLRDPATAKANWKACGRLLRLYGVALLVALAVAAWHVGGLLGYWRGYEDGLAARHENKESSYASRG